MWSNADEVQAFIEDHKNGRWEVGDGLTLPDIGQAYTVVAVRPFKHRGRFQLFLDLEAECAVEGCGEYFLASKEVHQWMSSPYLVRCCPEHRHGFSTPMQSAWKTEEQRKALEGQRRAKAEAKRAKGAQRGVNEVAVLQAIEELGLVAEFASGEEVVRLAIGKLPEPARGRDTRRQSVVRSLRKLMQHGDVAVDRRGRVLLA
jgi:hypothetical protein